MPINPRLANSGGSQFQVTVLPDTASTPTEITLTVTAAATANSNSIACSFSPNTGTIYAGTYIAVGVNTANAQYVVVRTTTNLNATTLPVEPLKKSIALNATGKTFAGIPVIGLESANMALQMETNQAVLLSNEGWQVTDASTGSFSFEGNMMIPLDPNDAKGATTVVDAFMARSGIYVERFLPNGIYHAGVCAVTNVSDTVQGAGYISLSVSFTGSNKPVQKRLFEVV